MVDVSGGCQCGNVRFEAKNCRGSVVFCHCSQCRRMSGHYWAATRAALADVNFASEDGLRWFRSSDIAERGFCGNCGASLFYRPIGSDHMGIAAGCLDQPTGLRPGKHIFCASKGDYYEIADDAPQIAD